MSLFRYVRLNIRTMICDHTFIFIMLILSATVTSLCLFFSYGIIQKVQDDNSELGDEMYFYRYDLPRTPNIRECIKRLKDDAGDVIWAYNVTVTVKDENGAEQHAEVLIDSPNNTLDMSGVYLHESMDHLMHDEKIALNGNVLPVIKTYNSYEMAGDMCIPEQFLTDDMLGIQLSFYVDPEPTAKLADRLNRAVAETFGGTSSYTPTPVELLKKQENNTFYAYAFMTVMIAVLNLSMYFRYIVEIRKKQIKIFRTCGAAAEEINTLFLIENLTELVIGYLTAFLLFRFVLFDRLLDYYPSFKYYYSAKQYIMTFAIFAVGSLLTLMLLISPCIRRSAEAGERSVE